MDANKKKLFILSTFKEFCDCKSLNDNVDQFQNDLNELSKKTNSEEEFYDLAYELINQKYKHII